MQAKFRYVMYAALLLSFLLIPMAYFGGSGVMTVAALIAFGALLSDTLITVKGNLPINSAVNSWTVDRYPKNWQELRDKWLQYFQYRQMLNITGFASLVAGAIFR